jgi:hypothetical protein
METLDEAIDAMVKANVFEEGVELLSILFHLHKATGVFNKLVTVGKQLNELSEKATKAVRKFRWKKEWINFFFRLKVILEFSVNITELCFMEKNLVN